MSHDHPTPELLENWRQGAEEFNAGRYWHAHEFWERGWLRLPPPEKEYVQALIQCAGVFHLLEKGRVSPALALGRRALWRFGQVDGAGGVTAGSPRIEIPGVREQLAAMIAGHDRGRDEPGAWLAAAHALRARLC